MWESQKTRLIGAAVYLALVLGFLLLFVVEWPAIQALHRWFWCGGP
jgi:lipopolysaccharide export LptBFGC system permease protein LptF